jgi:two-component system CheB/CheR fusion protein
VNRNDELARSNDDLSNLLSSVHLPILMLGADLRIRQFTKPAEKLLNLIDADIGQPISNIKPNIEIEN